MAADPFRTAKIGVIWNMDRCPIPPAFSDVTQIAPQVKLALSILGYEGEVHIGAIGDTRKLDLKIIRDMRVTGIVVEHSDSDEYPNGKHIMAHIYDWPMRNRGANILNISTDSRFLEDLCILGRKGFNILRVEQKSSGADAKYLWDWSDILNVVSQHLETNLLGDSSGQGQYNKSRVQQKPSDSQTDGITDVGPPLSQASSVKANLLLDSNGRADNNRDGNDEYNMLLVQQKPSGFPAPAKCPWEVGDVETSLSQCSSVDPNLLHYSAESADNNRDGKGQDVGPSLSQCSSVEPNLLHGETSNNRDEKGRDVEPTLSQFSSDAPYLLRDSSARADNNRDGNGQFGEYRGEHSAAKQPNTNISCTRQPQSGRKHKKSYLLLSKFVCS